MTKRTRSNSIESGRLKVNGDSTRDVLLVRGLVKKNIKTVGLKAGSIRAQMSVSVKSMLISNGVPESGRNLVSILKKKS